MDPNRFKEIAHGMFADAMEQAAGIPTIIQEVAQLRDKRDRILSKLTDRATEPQTISTMSSMALRDIAVTDHIIALAESIGGLRDRLLDLGTATRSSLAEMSSTVHTAQPIGADSSEKAVLLVRAFATVQVDLSVREFTVGTILVELYSLIGIYRGVLRSFLREEPGLQRVKHAASHLAKAAAEDVVHHFLPGFETARAFRAEVVIPHIEREIQVLANAMNEFERVFLLDRLLAGISGHAELLQQLVAGAKRDVDDDRRRLDEAVDAVKRSAAVA